MGNEKTSTKKNLKEEEFPKRLQKNIEKGIAVDPHLWRGTQRTKEQELAFLFKLSSYLLKEPDFKHPDVIGKIRMGNRDADKQDAENAINFLKYNLDWDESFDRQVKALSDRLNLQSNIPRRIVKDHPDLDINKEVSKYYHGNRDKWNPSDLWIVYHRLGANTSSNLEDINSFLGNSIKLSLKGTPTGMIGVSHKKGSGKLTIKNFGRKHSYIKIKNAYITPLVNGTKSIYLNINVNVRKGLVYENKIQIRTFSGSKLNSKIQGEIRGTGAYMSGKMGIKLIDEIVPGFSDRVYSFSGPLFDNKGNIIDKKRLSVIKRIIQENNNELFTDLKPILYNDFEEYSSYRYKDKKIRKNSKTYWQQMNNKINSKFQGIIFTYLFTNLSKGVKNEIGKTMLLHGRSHTEISSPFIKLT